MKKLLLLGFPALVLITLFAFKCSDDTNATDNIVSGAGNWASFDYQKGDTVLYLAATKWKTGTVLETGLPFNATAKNAATGELKYKIAEEGSFAWPDWKDFSQVVKPKRENWWTQFFTGNWQLGEAMAVNTYQKSTTETTTFDYQKATEQLSVLANGSYVWKKDGKIIKGNWIPFAYGPGIVLQKAYKGMDWTFLNQTNAITMHIRKLENGRLYSSGTEMSKAATRPMK
jgi:hypothetical protein